MVRVSRHIVLLFRLNGRRGENDDAMETNTSVSAVDSNGAACSCAGRVGD